MANAWLLAPLTPASITTTGTLQLGTGMNLASDYAGVVVQVACDQGTSNVAVLNIDFGQDVSIDTLMLFGVERFPLTGTGSIVWATNAQGPFTGAFQNDTFQPYAGSVLPVNGKGLSLWSIAAPTTARYVRLNFTAGTGNAGQSLRLARLVVGKRIQLERNFDYGAAFGVRDLGSLDFSRRGVLLRSRGAKLRTLGLTFSSVRKYEVESTTKPLLEQIGNTDMVALLTDPAVDAQRQNRAYYGPLVGDLGQTWRNAAAWEAKVNLVSIF